jgi:hypothetical protein
MRSGVRSAIHDRNDRGAHRFAYHPLNDSHVGGLR